MKWISRPSPAMLVACLALLVALGGTSVAAVKILAPRNSVGSAQVINKSLLPIDFKTPPKGPKGPAGPVGPSGPSGAQGVKGDPGAAATTLWAVVDGLGLLKKGSGVVSTSHPAVGNTRVKFNIAVDSCATVATINPPIVGAGMIITGGIPGQSDTVGITTTNSAGAAANHAFSIAAYC